MRIFDPYSVQVGEVFDSGLLSKIQFEDAKNKLRRRNLDLMILKDKMIVVSNRLSDIVGAQ